MRVTDSMVRANALRGLNANATSLAAIQEQVSTTKRLNRPSDDPAQVRQAVKLHDGIAELEQFTRNIDAGTRTLSASDTAMASAGDTIQRAHELAVEGANGTLTDANRQDMALEVGQLRDQLTQLAGTKVGDSYIFSGFKSDVPPDLSAGSLDTGAVMARIAPGTTVQVNVLGKDVFGPALAALNTMYTELTTPGTPVSGGTLTALDTSQQALLAGRATVGAVQNRLDATTDYLGQGIIAAKSLLSQIEDVDMTQAISQLSERQFTYQASLKVNASLLQLSLIDLLR